MPGRPLLSPERRQHAKERGERQATNGAAARRLEAACNGAEAHPFEATSHAPDISTTTRRDPDSVTYTFADDCPTEEAAPTAARTNAPASGPTRTADPIGTARRHHGRSDQRATGPKYWHGHDIATCTQHADPGATQVTEQSQLRLDQ